MNNKSMLAIFLIVSFLILPILLAGQYYIDDMGRATRGYMWWGLDGRPASDFMMSKLMFSKNMVDIFPLPLIIGATALACSMYMFYLKYIKAGIGGVLIAACYMISPSTPEILSYRFDSLPLLLSISIPLIVISFKDQGKLIEFVVGSVLCCVVFCIYQASVNLLVICFIIECTARMWLGFGLAESLIRLALRAVQISVAAVVYMKLILPLTFSGDHSANHPAMESSNILTRVISNANEYYNFLDVRFFNGSLQIFILAVFVISFASSVFLILNARRNGVDSPVSIWLSSAFLALSPFVVVMFSLGVVLTLQNSMTYFSRLYLGIGGVSLYAAFCFHLLCKQFKLNMLTYAAAIPLLYLYVYVYSFGVASKAQSEYTSTIINDIRIKTDDLSFDYFVFAGRYAKSPVLINSEKNFPIFKFNIPNYFYNWYWPYKRFEMDGLTLKKQPSKDIVSESLSNMCSSRIVSKGKRFDLYLYKNVLIVDFDLSCKN